MEREHLKAGRPRSEQARVAVLHAVDDLLVEVGYAAMTMKGIAERAGVSRQTVYRWWSTKAEILLEASAADAVKELSVEPGEPLAEVTAFIEALIHFLALSPAGAAYRALLGEAQHDTEVAHLLSSQDVLGDSAKAVIGRSVGPERLTVSEDLASALLVGPAFFWVLSGRDSSDLAPTSLAEQFLQDVTRT